MTVSRVCNFKSFEVIRGRIVEGSGFNIPKEWRNAHIVSAPGVLDEPDNFSMLADHISSQKIRIVQADPIPDLSAATGFRATRNRSRYFYAAIIPSPIGEYSNTESFFRHMDAGMLAFLDRSLEQWELKTYHFSFSLFKPASGLPPVAPGFYQLDGKAGMLDPVSTRTFNTDLFSPNRRVALYNCTFMFPGI
jgi:hypothetical protein